MLCIWLCIHGAGAGLGKVVVLPVGNSILVGFTVSMKMIPASFKPAPYAYVHTVLHACMKVVLSDYQ